MTEAVISYKRGAEMIGTQSIDFNIHSSLSSIASIPNEVLDAAIPALGGLTINHKPENASAFDLNHGEVFILKGTGWKRKLEVSIAPGQQADFPIPGSDYVIYINHHSQ